MNKFITFLKNNKWGGYVLLAVAFSVLGALFCYFTMQTKITTKDSEIKVLTQTNTELKASKETLITQNSKLKQQINTQSHQVIIQNPDGTITTTTDTNSQVITDLTTSIETKIKEEYEQKFQQWISEYEKTHTEEIVNPKTVSVIVLGGFGARTYTVDAILKAKIWGPVGVAGGIGVSFGKTPLLTPDTKNIDLIGKAGLSIDM